MKHLLAATALLAIALSAGAQSARTDRAAIANGESVYLRVGCQACHGTVGHGGAAPRLAPNTLPLPGFTTWVRNGTPGWTVASGMPAFPATVITDAELADIRAYLASLPPPPPVADIPLLGCSAQRSKNEVIDMSSVRALLIGLMLMPYVVQGQPTNAPAAGPVFAVGYVETQAKQADAGRTALARYRAALERQPGCVAVELFAQSDRPGHFAVLETWRDQAAFDARDAAAKRQLMDALQPMRVSDYDERPYKSLTLAPARTASANARSAFVVAHVDVAPNTQAPTLLQQLAEASRQEPGNLRFDVLQHAMRGNHFTVIEGWQDQDALDAHVATAHARAYRDALQPLTGSPLDERVYTAIKR